MDNDHPLHFFSLLSNSNLRRPICQILRSVLLDARHPRIEPRHAHGTGHIANRYVRISHAAIGGQSYHRGELQRQGG